MAARLDALLAHPALWRGDACARVAPALPSGFAELDRVLPGGGWPQGALSELLNEREGIGEFSLLAPALAHLTGGGRWVVFVSPPYIPYAPALEQAGLDLARLLLIRAASPQDRLWALEQALRSDSCGAALGWPDALDERVSRRLQLAAERGNTLGVLFAPARARPHPSAAALRLLLQPAGGRLTVHVLKRRGGSVAPLSLDLGRVLT